MGEVSLGSWTLPALPVPEALTFGGPSRLVVSRATVNRRDPPEEIVDPFNRGLADSVLDQNGLDIDAQLILPNGNAFCQRMVVSDGRLYSDFLLTEEFMKMYLEDGFDIGVHHSGLYKSGSGYYSNRLDDDPEIIEQPIIVLTSSEILNYGAWLIRVLPKIFYARDVFDSQPYKFLCYCDRQWQKDMLGFFGISEPQLVPQSLEKTYSAPMVIVPSWPSRWKFLDARTRAMIQQITTRAMARRPSFSGPRAIYISRSKAARANPKLRQGRPFQQEEELERRLEGLGIAIFSPETVPFEDQVLTFANADLVIGPQGAAMFNCIFCKPGTRVIDIEHLPFFLRGHSNLFASCQLKYTIFVGAVEEDPDPVHKALRIDMEQLIRTVEENLQRL
jgi:capsular polysaccharide biosynthesis protein